MSACTEYKAGFSFARDGWNVRTRSELVTTSDATNFFLKGRVMAFKDDVQIFARDRDVKIPRTIF